MVAEDFDGDGNLDLVMNGNDYGTEPSVGRYDALNGLFLKGDGKGNFSPRSILESGIFIPGDGKALVKLRSAAGNCLLAAGQNRGPLKVFELNRPVHCVPLQPGDLSALITYRNGLSHKQEIYWGSSFLSESGRFLNLDEGVRRVDITDDKGHTRTLAP